MPSGLRDLVIAGTVGAGLGAYLLLWFRWPVPIALGAAVILAVTVLVTSRSLARDPREADEAWRAAAPDLLEPPAGPLDIRSPGERSASGATTDGVDDVDDADDVDVVDDADDAR